MADNPPSTFVRRVADGIQALVLAGVFGLAGAVWTMNSTIVRVEANQVGMEKAASRQVALFEKILERATVGGFNAQQGISLVGRVSYLESRHDARSRAVDEVHQRIADRLAKIDAMIDAIEAEQAFHGRDK